MNAFRLAVATAFYLGVFAADGYSQVAQDRTLESLHAALNITAAQEGSWHDFEQAYTPDPLEMNRRRDAGENIATLAAPQRMDLFINMAESDLAVLKRRAGALKALYGALSPQQQSIFNRETLPPRQAPY